jgi:16S rRNA (cytosine967-C5)-methyltransferase
VESEPLAQQPDALRVTDAGNQIFETKVMKSGRLQVMDLGSQLIAALCAPTAASTVADVCAGAGGKTLMLADHSKQVFAGDISKRRLQDARDRAKELRIRNVSFPAELPLSEVDVALVDAPCSGIGTLSREPDQKWKLNPKAVAEFSRKQAAILDQTASKLKTGAVLVYATCSLLKEEDEAIVEAFLKAHEDFALEPAERFVPKEATANGYLLSLPHRIAGGGFFAARLTRR